MAASGQRADDFNQKMRNIKRAITLQDIDEAAAWYSSQPADVVKTVD